MATPTTPAAGSSAQSTLSEWAGPYVTNMLGKTEALSSQPYQVYQGPQTAGESGLQSKVFQGLGNLSFPGNIGQSFSSSGAYSLPPMMSGSSAMGADGSTGGISGLPTSTAAPTGPTGIASQYMNPYLQAVLNPQLEELRRQNDITNLNTNSSLTKAGAFGGGRQAIMNSENDRNMMQQMNKTVGEGYANAYDKAMGQFNTEQGQAKTLADMMTSAGTQQRGIEQEGITADYNEFLAQRDYPQKMLQFQQSMLQGLPISTVSTTPAAQTTAGAIQTAVGTAGSTYDLLKKLGLI
jgi:hypothetical protein